MGINWKPMKSWYIIGKNCVIWTSTRPHYCDRGNYLFHLEAVDDLAIDIDQSDLWPRYYFDFEVAKSESVAWLKTRNQYLENSEWKELADGESPYQFLRHISEVRGD